MTRKDFELIAAALNRAKPTLLPIGFTGDTHNRIRNSAETVAWRGTCGYVAQALATTNPNFNEPYFMAACGNVAVEGEA